MHKYQIKSRKQEKNASINNEKITVELQVSSSVTNKQNKKATKRKQATDFIEKTSFDSAKELDSFYLLDDGSISRQNLEYSFLAENFESIVEKIRNLTEDENSIKREAALSSNLYDNFGTSISDEQYSCAGKICALTLKYTSLSKQDLQGIEEFSKNYSFTNVSENEHGESIYKALFIETKDPSKLRVK